MGKAAYIGVDGLARKIKKISVGVDGLARKVKKAYIGVGGVARPFWGAERKPVYYGTLTPMSPGRMNASGASNASYAVFGGGCDAYSSAYYSMAEAYNTSGVKYTGSLSAMPFPARDWVATNIGPYAFFAGGYPSNVYASTNTGVIGFDLNLVATTPEGEDKPYVFASGASNSDYTFLVGGYNYSSDQRYNSSVRAYDVNLVKSSAGAYREAVGSAGSASTKEYAYFAGGASNTSGAYGYLTYVSAYGANKVRVDAPEGLPYKTRNPVGASVGNHVIFAGGYSVNNTTERSAYAYAKESMVRTQITSLVYGGTHLISVSFEDFCLYYAPYPSTNLYMYDENLVFSSENFANVTSLSDYEINSAAVIGDFALFAGAHYGSSLMSGKVYAYKAVDK